MEKKEKKTKVDLFIEKVKDHKWISIIIIIGIVIVSVSGVIKSCADAIKSIKDISDNNGQQKTIATPTPKQPSTVTPAIKPTAATQSTNTPIQIPVSENVVYYDVKVMLPSRMSGAEILVDGKPAIILEQTHTIVTIQVKEKQNNYRFTAQKGNDVCNKERTIRENNVKVFVCQ